MNFRGQSSILHTNHWVSHAIHNLTVDLLQALGVGPVIRNTDRNSVPTMNLGQKRSRPAEEEQLREENKRLRVSFYMTVLTGSSN